MVYSGFFPEFYYSDNTYGVFLITYLKYVHVVDYDYFLSNHLEINIFNRFPERYFASYDFE